MEIVNIIHVGNEQYNWDDLPAEKKKEYTRMMNERALMAIGYEKKKESKAV